MRRLPGFSDKDVDRDSDQMYAFRHFSRPQPIHRLKSISNHAATCALCAWIDEEKHKEEVAEVAESEANTYGTGLKGFARTWL